MNEELPRRECRCCRKPVPFGRLACKEHWAMLPHPLRLAIISTYGKHAWASYTENVREADKLWQAAGLWKPGVPLPAERRMK
jgi:hypothetical protein